MIINNYSIDSSNLQVCKLNEEEHDEWNQFVENHPDGTIYQTTYWNHSICEAFPHIRGFIIGIRNMKEAGALRAGIALCRVRSKLLGTRLISIPFAPYANPLYYENAHWEILWNEISRRSREYNARKIEIKTSEAHCIKNLQNIHSQNFYKGHVLKISNGIEAAFMSFSRTAVRSMVKKSERTNTIISEANNEMQWREFYELLFKARKKMGLPALPWELFASLKLHIPRQNRMLLIAKQNELAVAGLLCMLFGNELSLEFSACEQAHKKSGINQRIYWEAIKRAHANGCVTVRFGRTHAGNVGLRAYKMHWNTTEYDLSILTNDVGKKHNGGERENSRLYKWIRYVNINMPEKVYSVFSRMIYKHHA